MLLRFRVSRMYVASRDLGRKHYITIILIAMITMFVLALRVWGVWDV